MSAQQGVNVILDAGTWFWLQISFWVCSVFIIGFIVALVWRFIGEYRTPGESKRIRDASHRHRTSMVLAGDEGTAEWKTAERVGSAGYAVTKPEGKFKFHYTGLFPRRGKIPEIVTVDEGCDLEKTRMLASYVNELNTRKLFLKDAKIPVWFGVKSKSILASIYAIAAIQLTEDFQKAFNIAKASVPSLSAEVFPIDVLALKEMVVKTSYNQSQLNAIESDSEHIGEERVKKESLNKLVLLAGIGFGALGVIGLLVGMFLK